MSDVMTLELGFQLYHIGGMGNRWDGRDFRLPLIGRLGRIARQTNTSLEFRALRKAIPTRLPSFRVAAARQAGLLAMPKETEEMVRLENPGLEVRPVVVSSTADGHTLASPLPKGIRPGSAKLLVDRRDPSESRVLAFPLQPAALARKGQGEPGTEIETVLYRLPERGNVSAALGLLVGDDMLAMPRAVIHRPPVDSMTLDRSLYMWALASGTPIV